MGRIRRVVLVVVPAVVAALAVSGPALADSIVFVRGGNVWIAAPDGTNAAQLTNDGGYESPTQADDGTIVAARSTEENGQTVRRLHRMDAAGKALNPPVETLEGGLVGPLSPIVSPDGLRVAYHYFNNGPQGDEEPRVTLSYSDRNTRKEEITDPLGYYLNPGWLDNNTLLLPSRPGTTPGLQTYVIGGAAVNDWFDEPEGSLSGGVDVSADGTRLVAAVGSDRLKLYSLNGPPPAAPTPRCTVAGPVGRFHPRPNFSPDGTRLTWAEDDGVHVGQVDFAGCDTKPALVIAGGDSPAWGPANPPGGPSGGGAADGTAPTLSITLGKRRLGAALRRGYAFRATVGEACRLTAQLRYRGRVVAKGSRNGGPAPVALVAKFTRKARRQLGSKRRVRLTLSVTAVDAAGNRASAKRTFTLRR